MTKLLNLLGASLALALAVAGVAASPAKAEGPSMAACQKCQAQQVLSYTNPNPNCVATGTTFTFGGLDNGPAFFLQSFGGNSNVCFSQAEQIQTLIGGSSPCGSGNACIKAVKFANPVCTNEVAGVEGFYGNGPKSGGTVTCGIVPYTGPQS